MPRGEASPSRVLAISCACVCTQRVPWQAQLLEIGFPDLHHFVKEERYAKG